MLESKIVGMGSAPERGALAGGKVEEGLVGAWPRSSCCLAGSGMQGRGDALSVGCPHPGLCSAFQGNARLCNKHHTA